MSHHRVKSNQPAHMLSANKANLSRWQVAELAAQGKTVSEIATALGLTNRQIYYHLEHAETQTYLKQIRGALMESISSQLSDSATQAIKTLRDLCATGSERVRASAASSLLTHFRDITRDNIMGSQSTPELVMAAIPLIVQTVGKEAILDAIGVEISTETLSSPSKALTGHDGEALPSGEEDGLEGPSGPGNEDSE